MDNREIENKIKADTVRNLEATIRDAAQRYYTDGSSRMSDAAFDQLVDQLRKLDPDSKVLRTVGWGYDVFADTTPGTKMRHKYGVAGSLGKAYSFSEIRKSLVGQNVQLSLKLDGISCVLYYDHGILMNALTRGDGVTGIDITDKMHRIMPSTIPDKKFTGAVRCELLMRDVAFEAYRAEVPTAKNPRNTVAGLINAQEHSKYLPYITPVVYTIVGQEDRHADYDINAVDTWLKGNFSHVVPCVNVTVSEVTVNTFQLIADSLNSGSGYPIDGLVMKAINLNFSNGNEVAYDAQAFKFDSESEETTVEDIEWKLTKTKYLMPKLKVAAVQLAGTTVRAATAYNAQWIRDNDVGVGTKIKISKHGEIIPNVDEIIEATGCELPEVCPNCNADLRWDGVHLCCPNPDCADAMWQDTLIWWKNIAPADGISDKLRRKFLTQLIDAKVLDDASIESVMSLPLFNEQDATSVQNLRMVSNLNSLLKGEISAKAALLALNIPRLGDKTVDKAASSVRCWDALMRCARDEYEESDWVIIEDVIGKANAVSVRQYRDKLSRICLIQNRVASVTESTKAEVKGKVAITGALSLPRAAFEEFLAVAGWQVGDLTKSTKFLITDDPNSTSSKNMKADALGVPKISEMEFREKYM